MGGLNRIPAHWRRKIPRISLGMGTVDIASMEIPSRWRPIMEDEEK